ncbi:hypothetical protein [Massilimicrobiota timonensis]|uniref:hypothetical protein n=1 Tax=Massilimicrobiota timonensis TaxID=1776392 RepID=UPI00101C2AC9|nr:hypothetical protein [Massilimicrobiota timonensis]
MNNQVITKTHPQLPEVIDDNLNSIGKILETFHLPREILADNEEIIYAWRELPRELVRIPEELRDGLIARMCVAISVGLFDGAINYIWNAVVLNMRTRVKNYGLKYVGQIYDKEFEERQLNEMTDSELLTLCYRLELISEEGYFLLNQCREIRNNFSSAYPSIAQIDDRELIVFISRCCKYGISEDYLRKGINISELIDVIKAGPLSSDATIEWANRIKETFSDQRAMIIKTLHGLYCSSDSKEEVRINCLDICENVKLTFDDKVKIELINQHNNYISKNKEEKIGTSRTFFRKLGIIDLLDEREKHAIIYKACKLLENIHYGYNNFYYEPPLAEELYNITKDTDVPKTIKKYFVEIVTICYVGNCYGVSNDAVYYYQEMIKNFSPMEIGYLLTLHDENEQIKYLVNNYKNCKDRFLKGLELINKRSISPQQTALYNEIVNNK